MRHVVEGVQESPFGKDDGVVFNVIQHSGQLSFELCRIVDFERWFSLRRPNAPPAFPHETLVGAERNQNRSAQQQRHCSFDARFPTVPVRVEGRGSRDKPNRLRLLTLDPRPSTLRDRAQTGRCENAQNNIGGNVPDVDVAHVVMDDVDQMSRQRQSQKHRESPVGSQHLDESDYRCQQPR